MRRSGDWQTIWDDRILEIISSDEDQIGKVGNIANHPYIGISQSSVSRRCGKLADHGLLRPIGDGVYVITDEGIAYLEGRYNAETGRYIENGEENGVGEESGKASGS